MGRQDSLSTYAEGWTKGDAATILSAVADGYQLDDPNAGKIPNVEFRQYFGKLQDTVDSLRGGVPQAKFMAITEVVAKEEDDMTTAWCWWAIPGTSIQGSGLIKVGDQGVLSERLTYYTRLLG